MPVVQSLSRTLVSGVAHHVGAEVRLQGWLYRVRSLARSTFLLLRDRTGVVQCVAATADLKGQELKVDDAVEVTGTVRADARAPGGHELDLQSIVVLNPAARVLPFTSSSDISQVGADILIENRPLALRHPEIGDIFRLHAALVGAFRDSLSAQGFTEIFTSKIVASGTEGGSNLFEIKYFDRVAYLAQSPQLYKEQGVAGLERVFETGHVYRAEPHASSWHLTEYYSLDLELGFIDGPEDVMQVERVLLTDMFERINRTGILERRSLPPLPSMLEVPMWEFEDAIARLGRADLVDDLDREAERQLCAMAEKECGVPAVFVVGFPPSGRPFYTHPRGPGRAQSFDLLFRGLEITTGGQRLHRRADLEAALLARGYDVSAFEAHLRMFELGMPPHGGLAIGAERLTAQILGLSNIREATLYPRDRYRTRP
ncbi:MAG TPA: aspartate--tRNA(Asn) ligase [Candidatus Xenobia bacterium]|jgi:nondiscriminating aspartyl-tRNA synthetase